MCSLRSARRCSICACCVQMRLLMRRSSKSARCMMPAKFCPSPTGSMIVNASRPGGALVSRRKIRLFSAPMTCSWPEVFVSNKTDACAGTDSSSGTVNSDAWIVCAVLSSVASLEILLVSTCSVANFAECVKSSGSLNSFHNSGRHAGNSFSAVLPAVLNVCNAGVVTVCHWFSRLLPPSSRVAVSRARLSA